MEMLIADDDPLYRKILVTFAQRLEYQPLVARDGEEAWKIYRQQRPPFVLLDWMMPGFTGAEVCRRIRELGDEERPYIILVTTLSEGEKMLEGFLSGADDYIAKPFDREIFESRVKAASDGLRERLAREESMHNEIVDKHREAGKTESPELLDSLNALSRIYKQQGVYAKARAFVSRQIDISTRAGDDDAVQRLRASIAEMDAMETQPQGAR